MMQSNIFAQVAPLLREKQFNIDCDGVIKFLSRYRHGDVIYPGAMHRNLQIDIKLIYAILEICAENGLLEHRLDVYCPSCHRFTGKIYKSVFELSDYITCIHCNEEVENPIKHAIVIYQVV